MNVASISVRRYVFAAMLNAAIVLFGIVAYLQIGIEHVPNIDFGSVTVTTRMEGANPDVVDASITNIVEGAVSSIPGMDHLRSRSQPGVSEITASFNLDKNIDVAFNEVQAKVSQVLRLLPDQADAPVITKTDTSSFPVFWVTLTGNRTSQQLNQYGRTVVKKVLETIDGVGDVQIGGERERTIRVNLNLERMAAFGVTVQDITNAFRNQHLQLPGGYLVDGEKEDLLKLDLEYHDPVELERMVVGYRLGSTLYLRDVATVEDGLADFRRIGRYNGRPGLGLGIVKIAGRNTVEISRKITERLTEDVYPYLPPGLEVIISSDDSKYILELIASLEEHLIAGAFFAALVVWLFLRSFRATLIVAAAIPVSLLGAVLVMFFFDFTLNVVTMLGLLLLIGVVVDDAIVVLENVQRRLDRGETDRARAATEGANEVLLAITASTLTLAAIFAVVLFMPGIPGRLFRAFGVVVTCGVMVSLFVSLTLTPMLCSRHLAVASKHGQLHQRLAGGFERFEGRYRIVIRWVLGHRWIVVGLAALVVLSTPIYFRGLGGEFFPQEDQGSFMVIVKTPLGSSIEYSDDRLREVENVLLSHDVITTMFATIGGRDGRVNQGIIWAHMKDRSERDIKQYELIPIIRQELAQIPGVMAFPASLSIAGSSRGQALNFALQGPDLTSVAHYANELREALAAHPEFGNIDLELDLDLPQISLTVNRELAAELGFSARDIAQAANVLAGGLNVAKYSDDPGDGERYDVRLKAAGNTNLRDLSKIYLRSPNRTLVRMDTVAEFTQTLGPAVIERLDRQYSANFYIDATISMAEGIELVESVAADTLPPSYKVQMLGAAEQFGRTSSSMGFAFLLALVLVYMVLASQFNSYRQPLIIMVAQPLAIVGGVAALNLMGQTLNLFSGTGLVLLIGLVAKNSILLVDITNQLCARGKSVDEALLEACPRRLRPILMTSLTIICAMLVPAFGLGAGVELSAPLATAVVGGMISSTLLTLVVVPAIYSLVENSEVSRISGRWSA